jgi:hypothetical protein
MKNKKMMVMSKSIEEIEMKERQVMAVRDQDKRVQTPSEEEKVRSQLQFKNT